MSGERPYSEEFWENLGEILEKKTRRRPLLAAGFSGLGFLALSGVGCAFGREYLVEEKGDRERIVSSKVAFPNGERDLSLGRWELVLREKAFENPTFSQTIQLADFQIDAYFNQPSFPRNHVIVQLDSPPAGRPRPLKAWLLPPRLSDGQRHKLTFYWQDWKFGNAIWDNIILDPVGR